MRIDPNIVYDGFTVIDRGINSALPESLIPRTQFSRAVNVSFRGYQPTTRPGWTQRTLKFIDSSGAVDVNLQTNFQKYIFQGAIAFERRNQLVISVGGRLFRIRPDQWDVLDITPSGDSNAGQNYRSWFCEAEDFVIIQDGLNAALIYDGSKVRRSDVFGITFGKREVPTGTAMTYSQGRLVVALSGGTSFAIGDIVGGPSGTATYGSRDAVLRFTENSIIAGGGYFSIPINAGKITAIAPIAQVDTSTGQGPTQVFTQRASFSISTPSDRLAWANANYPIQTYSALQSGATSERAVVGINGDLWMRALDGIRTFQISRREFRQWTNTPQSSELDWILNNDDEQLLGYSSGAWFDNRLFVTVSPYRNFQHGVCHRGLGVIDFSPVSYLGKIDTPMWEGVWTGLQILQIISCTFNDVRRCFMFNLDSTNKIQLWEMTTDQPYDLTSAGTQIPVACSFETGAYSFPNDTDQKGGLTLKKLLKGWLWIKDIDKSVTFSVFYRANDDPCWHSWASWSACATMTTCGSGNCTTPENLNPQYRRPYLLPDINDNCDTSINIPDNLGEQFELRIEWTGMASFSKLLLSSVIQQETVTDVCPANESCVTRACCPPYNYSYVAG